MASDSVVLRLGIDSKGAVTGSAQFVKAGEKVAGTATKVDARLRKVTKSMRGLGSAATSARGTIASLFGGITGALVLRSGIQAIASFERSIAVLGVVTEATTDQLGFLSGKARDLGADTQFTANQVARGMLELGRIGFTTNEILAAIPNTLDLAIVAEGNLAEVSKIAASTMRAFRLEASEMIRVVDALTHTANSSGTTVQELGQSMRFVGPAARAFGATVEETSAFLGVLADNNIRGTLAGTALRAMFIRLQKPTSEAREGLKLLGLGIRDVNPQVMGLTQVFQNLSDAIEEVGPEEGLRAFTKLFGRRQISGALIGVIPEALEKIRGLQDEMSKLNKATSKAARTIENTLVGAFFELKAAMEAIALTAGEDGLLGIMRSIVDTVTDVARALAGMTEKIEGNKEAFMAAAEAIKTIGIVIGASFGLKVISGLFRFLTGLQRVTIAATSFKLLSGVGAAFALSLGPIPALLAAMGAGLLIFKDEMIEVEGQMVSVGDIALATFEFIGEAISLLVEEVVKGFRLMINEIQSLLDDTLVGQFISKTMSKALKALDEAPHRRREGQVDNLLLSNLPEENVPLLQEFLSNPKTRFGIVKDAPFIQTQPGPRIEDQPKFSGGPQFADVSPKGLTTENAILLHNVSLNKEIVNQRGLLNEEIKKQERLEVSIASLQRISAGTAPSNVFFRERQQRVKIGPKQEELRISEENETRLRRNIEILETVEKNNLTRVEELNPPTLGEKIKAEFDVLSGRLLALISARGAASEAARKQSEAEKLLREGQKQEVEILGRTGIIRAQLEANVVQQVSGFPAANIFNRFIQQEVSGKDTLSIKKGLDDIDQAYVKHFRKLDEHRQKDRDSDRDFKQQKLKVFTEIQIIEAAIADLSLSESDLAVKKGLEEFETKFSETALVTREGAFDKAKNSFEEVLILFEKAKISAKDRLEAEDAYWDAVEEGATRSSELNQTLADELFILKALRADPDVDRSRIELSLDIERSAVMAVIGEYKRLEEVIERLSELDIKTIENLIKPSEKVATLNVQEQAKLDIDKFDIAQESRRVPSRSRGVFGELEKEISDFAIPDFIVNIKVTREGIDAAVTELERLEKIAGGATEESARLKNELIDMHRAVPQLEITAAALQGIGTVISDELGTAISDVILGITDMSTAFRDFAVNVLQSIVQTLIQAMIDALVKLIIQMAVAAAFGGVNPFAAAAPTAGTAAVGSAKGNVFAGSAPPGDLLLAKGGVFRGKETPLADGGIFVGSDDFVPAAQGSVFGVGKEIVVGSVTGKNDVRLFSEGGVITTPTKALMGEAGPEAVLPLKRGGDGKLGVTVHGLLSEELASERTFQDVNPFTLRDLLDLPNQIKQSFIDLRQEFRAKHQDIPAFASGGVVTKPTLAIVGEKEPELITPLRDILKAPIGQDRESKKPNITINFNLPKGTNPESFRRSQTQIARQLRQMTGGFG